MSDLNLGVIGNSSFGALIDKNGRVVWCCLPHFDGDPVFCSLLKDHHEAGPGFDDDTGETGFFDVAVDGFHHSEQHYLRNTAILITTIHDANGASIEITDFAPRFKRLGRNFRPMMMVRHIRPVEGNARIRVRLRPVHSWGAGTPAKTRGSNHIRFVTPDLVIRCTTDAPVSFISDEIPFVLERPITMLIGPDESLTSPIEETGREFYDQTHEYWREWSRYLSIPFEWQDAVIRAAITLKLSNFEESGGIVAAMTTSIPEAANSERNWDYRYCWLRDAHFVVNALNRLGATRTMEDHMSYVTNVITAAQDGHLQPVYGIRLEPKLTEEIVTTLPGYRGMGPVRIGNQAYEHIQNDVYGSVILASTQAFFDQRLAHAGDIGHFRRLEMVGEHARKLYNQPDAGLWELRTMARVHTFSSVMCWAACDRLARVGAQLGLSDRAAFWRREADTIRKTILEAAVDPKRNTLVESFGGKDMDGSLLLFRELGFLQADDPLFAGTVEAVAAELKQGNYLYRYKIADDFGFPETSFSVVTFWYIDALSSLGRKEEARELFENMLAQRNHLGLLSEDIDHTTGELWGNFPQTYSMVGLINSAMALSIDWREAF